MSNKLIPLEKWKTAYIKVNQAIDDSVDAVVKANKAAKDSTDAVTKANSVQTQLDTIVVEGDSSVEAAQARVDYTGQAFTTLKALLDNYLPMAADSKAELPGLLSAKDKVNRGWIDVREYGAKGDGVTLDADAIQNALNKKGTIYVPDGVYLIDKTLIITSDTTLLMHPKAVLKRQNNAVYAVLTNGKSTDLFTGYNGNGNIKIIGGTIELDGAAMPTTCNGISFGHGKNIEIADVVIKNVYNGHHIEMNSSKNVRIHGSRFEGFTHNGTRAFSEAVQIDLAKSYDVFPLFGAYDKTPCENVTVENCYFNNVGRGVGTHVTDVGVFHDFIVVRNNVFDTTLDFAVNALIFRKAVISGNKMLAVTGGVKLDGAYECTITDNHIKQSTGNGIESSYSSQSIIKGNNITGGATNGITIFNNGYSIIVTNNYIYNNAGHGVNVEHPDVIISDCIVKGNGSHGIYVHDTKDVRISSCQIHLNNRHGVQIASNATNITVSDCFIASNNQSNDGSHNVIIVTNSDANRIVNNVIRAGTQTNKPVSGIYVGSGCDNNVIIMNDLKLSGSTSNLNDLSGNSITSTNNLVA
ncbi:right-handed parallel beta-helix repeat-containing protein [Mesobacillus zeae]|uniref:Right-handed parallel beta-helix repeat-containing protein n=1 Tax=Mesobacillus zeae TaxID=1917180 RepID=A0A398B6F3_9BACI|nr:right-handed parallel beta-helix repeat-containing protein [Mesobacillus zeae]RID85679.1 hypothetical protein D1970_08985 [Mesobacillus zeae]